MVTGCLRMMKVAILALGDEKVFLVNNGKYETLSIYIIPQKNSA